MAGPTAGFPRVYDIASELISHVDGQVDAESLRGFIAAYHLIYAGDFTGDGTVDGDDILGMVSELRYRGVPDAMITPLFGHQVRDTVAVCRSRFGRDRWPSVGYDLPAG